MCSWARKSGGMGAAAFHASLVTGTIRLNGSIYLELPNHYIPPPGPLSIPTLDRLICLLTQHLKHLEDIRLLSALQQDRAGGSGLNTLKERHGSVTSPSSDRVCLCRRIQGQFLPRDRCTVHIP